MLLGRTRPGVALAGACFVALILQVQAQSPHRAPYIRPSTRSQPVQTPGAQLDVITGSGTEKAYFESAPNESQRPSEVPGLSVDVINGSARRTQVFDEEQTSASPKGRTIHEKTGKRTAQGKVETAPQVPDVEVINGSRLETRRFEGAEDELEIPWIDRRSDHPVVIGVTSVGTASGRGGTVKAGSTAPVVVGVASSEEEGHGANAKPVAYRVSPGPPRRPQYHPGPPGF